MTTSTFVWVLSGSLSSSFARCIVRTPMSNGIHGSNHVPVVTIVGQTRMKQARSTPLPNGNQKKNPRWIDEIFNGGTNPLCHFVMSDISDIDCLFSDLDQTLRVPLCLTRLGHKKMTCKALLKGILRCSLSFIGELCQSKWWLSIDLFRHVSIQVLDPCQKYQLVFHFWLFGHDKSVNRQPNRLNIQN